ncbi:F-box/WD repeat-containing protein [Criblamydia sequanensis]|uniref:F-box and WD repeat-containing protein n=1 Tax=Candidatus Criblamydia sequanensis CRIB-18 TaxID=1437425 RepID=A0A090D0J4_9BACT|nr:F-box/WD repeat-containing protein [Criblamydia sequanensis]CDR34816.1 F-box and WD repeat-containing protein [Criblamydia sequanensis CRIB-18]
MNRVGSKPSIIEGLNESEETTGPGIHSLPAELIIEIFSNLDFKSLNMAALTCKLLKDLCKDSALIKNLFFKSLPETAKTLYRTTIDDTFLWQSLMADAHMRSTSGKIEPTLTKIKPTSTRCLKLINGKIFAAAITGAIEVFDGTTGKEIKRLEGHTLEPRDFKMFDGKLISASSDNTIRIWDLEKGETVRVLGGHAGSVIKLEVYKGTLISTSYDKTLRLWDINSGKELKVLAPPNYLHGFCLSDGKIFSVAGDYFYIWDAANGNEIKVIEYPHPVKNFIAANRKLFIASKKGVIHVLDIETNELKKLEGHTKFVTTMVESNGKLFSGSEDRTIRIWDVDSGRELWTLRGHSDQITHIKVLDKNLISYSLPLIPRRFDDQTIRLWDIDTGRELRKFDTSNDFNPVLSLCSLQLSVGKIIAWSSKTILIFDFSQKPQNPII